MMRCRFVHHPRWYAGYRPIGLRNNGQFSTTVGVLPDNEHDLAAPGMERVVNPPLDQVLAGSMSLLRGASGSREGRRLAREGGWRSCAAATNASITPTGLFWSTQSSRHSGNSIIDPQSAPLNKTLHCIPRNPPVDRERPAIKQALSRMSNYETSLVGKLQEPDNLADDGIGAVRRCEYGSRSFATGCV
jgi:hypothetical protein